MSLPTLTDLKSHLNMTSTSNDDELTEMLDAAVDVVSGIVGQLDSAPVTETHYGVSSSMLILRQMPVSAVTSISYAWFSGSPTTVTGSDYVLDPATGIVRMVTGGGFVGDVTVTYTAGNENLPAAIRLAVLEIAAHLWETQRGTAPTPLAPQDDFVTTPGLGYAIPNRARELLAPYVRPSIA